VVPPWTSKTNFPLCFPTSPTLAFSHGFGVYRFFFCTPVFTFFPPVDFFFLLHPLSDDHFRRISFHFLAPTPNSLDVPPQPPLIDFFFADAPQTWMGMLFFLFCGSNGRNCGRHFHRPPGSVPFSSPPPPPNVCLKIFRFKLFF